ncbi:hypothetical protein, partial [Solimonas fluminis]|uniref:hypothetical protein n=1 Tax=Solimonas fluminis TaxID=2086571 RepID=UPI001A9CA10F
MPRFSGAADGGGLFFLVTFSLDKCSDRTHPLQVCQDMVYTLRFAQVDVREAVMAEVKIVSAL